MHTASREWCDRVAARNAIEVAKAQRAWQPGLFTGENPEVAENRVRVPLGASLTQDQVERLKSSNR